MLAKFSVVEIIQKYQVSLEKENFVLCSCTPRSGHIKLGSFMPQSQHSRATTEKKKCTKKCDAGAKLLFANLTQLLFCHACCHRCHCCLSFCHACCHRCHCCLSSQYCCDPEVLLQWLLGITIFLFFAQKVNYSQTRSSVPPKNH